MHNLKAKSKLADLVLVAGFFVLIAGGFTYLSRHQASSPVPTVLSTSGGLPITLTERNAAVKNAQITGSKSYGFDTNYLPGMGRMGSADAQKMQEDLIKKCEEVAASGECQKVE